MSRVTLALSRFQRGAPPPIAAALSRGLALHKVIVGERLVASLRRTAFLMVRLRVRHERHRHRESVAAERESAKERHGLGLSAVIDQRF